MSSSVDPARTIAVFVGASAFPKLPALEDNVAFAASARAFQAYLLRRDGFGMPQARLLDLFDSEEDVIRQNQRLVEFLKLNCDATDLLFYYVGHGGFLRNREYFLALRSTAARSEWMTGLRIGALAHTFEEWCHQQRKYLLLDCCFAGEAVREFQSSDLSTLVESETFQALPETGTSLLVAASKDQPAIVPTGYEQTMFSKCLLDALDEGIADGPERLSLTDLGRATERRIRAEFGLRAVRPEVHSPGQDRGDLAELPLFPNTAWQPPPPVVLPEEVTRLLANSRVSLRKAAVEELGNLTRGNDDDLGKLALEELQQLAEKDDSLSVRAAAKAAMKDLEPRPQGSAEAPAPPPIQTFLPTAKTVPPPPLPETGSTPRSPLPAHQYREPSVYRPPPPAEPPTQSEVKMEDRPVSESRQQVKEKKIDPMLLPRAFRNLLIWIASFFGFVFFASLTQLEQPSEGISLFIATIAMFIALVPGFIALYWVYRTARALGLSRIESLAWIMAVAFFNILALIALSGTVIVRCLAAGIPVGILGPKIRT